MEIAKNTRWSLLKKKKIKCKNCKSKLRVTYMDLHRVWSEENILVGYFAVCPCCHKRIDIPMRKARRIL